jgi:hypothetical protein
VVCRHDTVVNPAAVRNLDTPEGETMNVGRSSCVRSIWNGTVHFLGTIKSKQTTQRLFAAAMMSAAMLIGAGTQLAVAEDFEPPTVLPSVPATGSMPGPIIIQTFTMNRVFPRADDYVKDALCANGLPPSFAARLTPGSTI